MGLLSSIGGMLNDITGATSSAKLQHKYQKEFAKNAHQWEVKDLQKAGLNPILSAGGSGATAGGAGGTTGASGVNPLEIVNGITSAKKTMAEEQRLDAERDMLKAQEANLIAQNPYIANEMKAKIGSLNAKSAHDIEKTWSEQGTAQNIAGRSLHKIKNSNSAKGFFKAVDNLLN